MTKEFYQLLGLAYRAGKLKFGESALESIKAKKARLVLMTCDMSDKSKKRVLEKCEFYSAKYLIIDENKVLCEALGLKEKMVKLISVNDMGFAKSLMNKGGKVNG